MQDSAEQMRKGIERAWGLQYELFNKALQRGLFRTAEENMAHLEALVTLDSYIKETLKGWPIPVPAPERAPVPEKVE